VLSSLIGLVHEATTRHVQCAEHGEQIHSDVAPVIAGGARWIANEAEPAAAHDRPAAARSQPAAAFHGHEHCVIASATRDSRLAPCPPAIATTHVASAALAVVVPHDAVVRHDPIYRTAPKTSPPT
jgi:hypothetical protein